MKQCVLVTGGAGFIGSHTTRWLMRHGYEVVVVDDLSQGHASHVPEGKLVQMNLGETTKLASLMLESNCVAVLHFAASALVAESMLEPGWYFANNVAGSISLLTAMVRAQVKHLVFSSSAAVYGHPPATTDDAGNFVGFTPIRETCPLLPINPYGATKVMGEDMLHWFGISHGITSVALRYFNAAGADPGGSLCECHKPETHLIPCLIKAAVTGQPVTINGNDYHTDDGTCVRDFIHVEDLAQAHVQALQYLLKGGRSEVFNVGTGLGHSILQAIQAVQEVTGKQVAFRYGPRREGDPVSLIAEGSRIRTKLGWSPQYPDLRSMVHHAWRAMPPD